MKLLNLTAALFLGGVLQAQNPLPAIHPQPQEVTLSTNRLKAPHGFTLSGMQHPDEDAMRLIRQTLSITDNFRSATAQNYIAGRPDTRTETFRSLSISYHTRRNRHCNFRQSRSFLRSTDIATIGPNRRTRQYDTATRSYQRLS